MQNRALLALFWGGLLSGTGDLIFAFAYYGLKPGVFQSVAAGLLGRSVYKGGIPTMLLGIALHYLIAFIWSAIFWIVSRRLTILVKHAVPAGLLYGLVIYYGMNLVVLPLSALQTKAWPPPFAWWPIAAHMLVVGLPIALAVRKYSR